MKQVRSALGTAADRTSAPSPRTCTQCLLRKLVIHPTRWNLPPCTGRAPPPACPDCHLPAQSRPSRVRCRSRAHPETCASTGFSQPVEKTARADHGPSLVAHELRARAVVEIAGSELPFGIATPTRQRSATPQAAAREGVRGQ